MAYLTYDRVSIVGCASTTVLVHLGIIDCCASYPGKGRPDEPDGHSQRHLNAEDSTSMDTSGPVYGKNPVTVTAANQTSFL